MTAPAPMNQSWIQFLPSSLRSKLDGRYTLQKILSNTGWLFADRILRMGVGLFVGVWVARYLGPEQFGLFNYAIAFVTLLTPFATLGLDGIVVRDLVHDPDCRDRTLGTTFVLKLLGATVTFLTTLGAIVLLRPSDRLDQWLVGIIAAGMLFQTFDTIDFWFQSQMQSKYTVYAKNLAFVLFALVRVALIQAHAPLVAFAWAGFAETAIGTVGLVIAYRTSGNDLATWRVSLARARTLLHDSWTLIFSGVAIMIYMKIDQLMLGEMVGKQAVGIYAAATRISEVWYFIPTAIVSSVTPAIIEAKKTDEALYHQRLQQLFNLMAGLTLLISISMTLLSNSLVKLLFGQTYFEAGSVLAIHVWSALFVFFGVAQSPSILLEDLQNIAFARVLLGAVINVLLNLILIPTYGTIGAAISTLISYAVINYFSNLFFAKTRIVFLMQTNAIFLKWIKN